jgi:RHS repeat-associated protein
VTTLRSAYDGWNPAKGGPGSGENWDVWADLDSNGLVTTRYLRGDAVDQLFARLDSLTPYWELTDQQGSVRALVDMTGAVQDAVTYDGWGAATQTHANVGGRYLWTGREFDVETGLQYNRARYYDPHSGRWLTQDPVGFDAGDTNLYRYVRDEPSIRSDASGLYAVFFDGTTNNLTTKRTIVGRMYEASKDPQKEYVQTPLAWKNLTQFQAEGIKTVKGILAAFKKCKDLNVDLIGYSRGAALAIGVANLLNNLAKKTPGVPPINVKFMGLIDPVSTGVIGAPTLVPNNVKETWAGVRDGSKDLGDRFTILTSLIFARMDVQYGGPSTTILYFPLTHGEMGRNPVVAKDLYDAAKNAGMPLGALPAK